MKASARKSTVSRIRPNRAPRGIGVAEWDARCELAAAFRIAARLGYTDFLGTHFSLRVPGTEDEFLINPFGTFFEEITASSLIRVDTEGALTGGAEPNPIPQEVIDYTAQQGRTSSVNPRNTGGKLLWAALKRKLDREDPEYRH